MPTGEAWKLLFEGWPAAIPRKGLVISKLGEIVSFQDFLISGGILLLERDKPDTIGARKVMIAYDDIALVKFVDTLELSRFQVMGFQKPL
jgi:hypothetical protein